MIKTVVPEKNIFVVGYAIWYYLYNLKNVKNTHGGVLILVAGFSLQLYQNWHSLIGVFHIF